MLVFLKSTTELPLWIIPSDEVTTKFARVRSESCWSWLEFCKQGRRTECCVSKLTAAFFYGCDETLRFAVYDFLKSCCADGKNKGGVTNKRTNSRQRGPIFQCVVFAQPWGPNKDAVWMCEFVHLYLYTVSRKQRKRVWGRKKNCLLPCLSVLRGQWCIYCSWVVDVRDFFKHSAVHVVFLTHFRKFVLRLFFLTTNLSIAWHHYVDICIPYLILLRRCELWFIQLYGWTA